MKFRIEYFENPNAVIGDLRGKGDTLEEALAELKGKLCRERGSITGAIRELGVALNLLKEDC